MNSYKEATFFGVATLALIIVNIALVVATPPLTCANFTGDKHTDCQYIRGQDLEEGEEQDLLWILWEQGYESDSYHHQTQTVTIDLALNYNEIETSRFILASKITFFALFNYFLVSLTKWSVIARCLPAV